MKKTSYNNLNHEVCMWPDKMQLLQKLSAAFGKCKKPRKWLIILPNASICTVNARMGEYAKYNNNTLQRKYGK